MLLESEVLVRTQVVDPQILRPGVTARRFLVEEELTRTEINPLFSVPFRVGCEGSDMA